MTTTPAASERTWEAEARDLKLFVIAGEHSGDALGAKLMAALDQGRRGRLRYLGVGGPQMAAAGLSNKEIGDRLDIKEKTVKHYVTNILQKLHLRNRVEAAVLLQKKANGI